VVILEMATDVTRLEENKRLVRRLHDEVWNAGELEVVDEVLAEGYVQHDPVVTAGRHGRDTYRENVAAFRSAFSDLRVVTEDVIAEGDIVVLRHTGSGTHDGPFVSIHPTGNSFEISGVAVHRIEDGRVAESVLAPFRVSKRCRARVIVDRRMLKTEGAHALYIKGLSIRTETVAQRRGARPWTRAKLGYQDN
jgi:steroid delta-isomerase-like uncharacterized protein